MATREQIPSNLTLEIEANISPEAFLAASRSFFGFVEEVASSIEDQGKCEWSVRVREGSNLIALEPEGALANQNFARVLSKARESTNRLLEGDIEGAGLSERALGFIKSLSQLASKGRRSTYLRLWIERAPIDIKDSIARNIQEHWRSDYTDFGSIEGKLEAIQDSAGLQLRVRDNLFGASVKCDLPDNMLRIAFDSFRKRVEVTGLIHFRSNGTPISIKVEGLEPLPDDDELPSHEEIRGILAA